METLLDRLRKNNPADNARKNRHAVTLLAHREEIVAALKDGWSGRKIWQQMVADGMIAMSYACFCRHMKKRILPGMGGTLQPPGSAPAISKPREKSTPKQATPSAGQVKSVSRPASDVAFEDLPEKERLELLKQEAFASARPKKPAGPLITRPKTAEEERRALFGD